MKSTPQSYPPGSRPGTVFVPQGVLLRGPAFILDTLACSLIAALILGGHASLVKVVLVTLAVEFAYFSAWEGALATTPGKRVFGLRVVRAGDGRPCGPPAALVRTLLRIVDNILFSLPGLVAIVSSPRRQRIGDRVAGTLVVSEVPEQLLQMLGGISALRPEGAPEDDPGDDADGGQTDRPGDHAGDGLMPDQVMRDLAELARRQGAQVRVLPGRDGETVDAAGQGPAPPALEEEVLSCPFCETPMDPDEIVCRHCRHYVNQVSAHGETDDLAPVPLLYSEDRNHRFDALWRLVFAADGASLEAVRTAVPSWPQDDRLLAVRMFSEVADPRPVAFLDFMADDPDAAVKGLAGEIRRRLVP